MAAATGRSTESLDSMRTVVERASHNDIPRLVDLMEQFYAESSYALDRSWASRSFERLLGDEGLGAAWLARHGADVAGYVVVTLKHSMEFGGVDAFIDDLFVRANFRRQGVASALLSALFEHCRDVHAAAVHVEVGPENAPARALYRTCGLSDQGRVTLTAKVKSIVASRSTRLGVIGP